MADKSSYEVLDIRISSFLGADVLLALKITMPEVKFFNLLRQKSNTENYKPEDEKRPKWQIA
jgi:hypothetical protein